MAHSKSGPRRHRRSDPDEAEGAAEAVAPSLVEDGAPIEADHVSVTMGAVGRVDSERLEVQRGAVGGVRADSVDVHLGVLGGALAGRASIRQSIVRGLAAREVGIEQSFVRTLVALEVRIERASFVGLLVARRVTGDVRVLLDWRGALAFGAAFGLVAGLVGRVRGGARRRG